MRTVCLWVWLVLALLPPGQPRAAAHGAQYQDTEIKAAFLYNFAKFVEWPHEAFARADSPLVIAIAGDDPFGGTLDRLVEGKRVNGHTIVVRRLRNGSPDGEVHVLFITPSATHRARQLVERVKDAPVLTVGDQPGLAKRGVVVNFYVERDRVRFEVSLEAARRARLSISSKLLNVARVLDEG